VEFSKLFLRPDKERRFVRGAFINPQIQCVVFFGVASWNQLRKTLAHLINPGLLSGNPRRKRVGKNCGLSPQKNLELLPKVSNQIMKSYSPNAANAEGELLIP